MLSFNEAQKKIISHTIRAKPALFKISDALDLVLAEDIYSKEDIPFFTNSAMDGYAVKSIEVKNASSRNPVELKVTGAIKAGDGKRISLPPGEACEIFTGAILPDGADAIAIVEDVERIKNTVRIFSPVKEGEHVRFRGEEIKRKSKVIPRDTFITPEVSGVLANLGSFIVKVYPPPRVGILVSGNELLAPGRPLIPGKIRDSNSTVLSLLCQKLKIKPLFVKRVKDVKGELAQEVKKALGQCDYLLISGGISMGKYDLVKEVLKDCGVSEIFWRLKVRPGKPVYFGKKKFTLVFGLPGNPASVVTSFYQFVMPSLLYFMGFKNVFLPERKAILENSINKKPELVYILRGFYYFKDSKTYVRILKGQGSNQLLSFLNCNCFVVLDKKKIKFNAGEEAGIHILPGRQQK